MTGYFKSGLLTTNDVIALTRLSRTTIYRKRCSGDFPAPCGVGAGRIRWRRRDIDAWIDDLPQVDPLTEGRLPESENDGRSQ